MGYPTYDPHLPRCKRSVPTQAKRWSRTRGRHQGYQATHLGGTLLQHVPSIPPRVPTGERSTTRPTHPRQGHQWAYPSPSTKAQQPECSSIPLDAFTSTTANDDVKKSARSALGKEAAARKATTVYPQVGLRDPLARKSVADQLQKKVQKLE